LDSWFYPKDAKTDPGGGGGAVVNWTSMSSVFPSGMAAFQRSIGLPMVMHNRQWSMQSDYVNHWTDIPWYSGPHFAIPKDPEAFFRRFFSQQVGWGLTMYEQDWMCTQVRYDAKLGCRTHLVLVLLLGDIGTFQVLTNFGFRFVHLPILWFGSMMERTR
jgi:hypothetical protein